MKIPLCWAAFALISGLAVASGQNVRISEFMANNDRTLAAPDGEFTDWIEIQNADSVAVDLAGWYLTDNPLVLNKWRFPSVTLQPGTFLVVFASGKNLTADPANLHTSFQLSANGGFLALVKPDGTTLASAFSPYPAVDEDEAFGIAENVITLPLLANTAPQILVPTNAADLASDWKQLSFQGGPKWFTRLGHLEVVPGFNPSSDWVATLLVNAMVVTAIIFAWLFAASSTRGDLMAGIATGCGVGFAVHSIAETARLRQANPGAFWHQVRQGPAEERQPERLTMTR